MVGKSVEINVQSAYFKNYLLKSVSNAIFIYADSVWIQKIIVLNALIIFFY